MQNKKEVNDLYKLFHEYFKYKIGVLYWRKRSANRIHIGDKVGATVTDGRLQTHLKGKAYLVHRIIFLMHKGYLPDLVDHKDNNRTNNKISNLREATFSQNSRNSKIRSNNTSGFKNIVWDKSTNKWLVSFTINSKTRYIGRYTDKFKAIDVANTTRKQLYKGFARVN